jgi:translation initiation factor 1 (eIF-1/SUI1)
MRLKIILFLCLISSASYPAQDPYNSNQETDSLCNSTDVDKYIEAEYATFLDITVEQSRKWTKNYFRLVTDKYKNPFHLEPLILEKYKMKFNANITVSFDNGLKCRFPAKIRIQGDHRDHTLASPPITSLDVKLLRGNINSSTEFKLFLPHTKNSDNEIFITALLKNLNFISPKTYYIPTRFNDQEVMYLFQEKITKELLESNRLREGPILEGDERFLWREDTAKEFDGLNLARLVNRDWADKSLTSLNISKEAVSVLNKAYLQYLLANHYYKKRTYTYLNSAILGNNNELATKKNQEFQALLIALRASHGLRPHNRSFYYDPMYIYFLPIYYDGSSTILDHSSPIMNQEPHNLNQFKKVPALTGLNKDSVIGSNYAITSIQNLDKNKFINQLKILGVNISHKKLDKALNKIKLSLQQMSDSSDKYYEEDIYKPYFSIYNEPKKLLVFSNGKIPKIIVCDFSLTNCNPEILSHKEYSKLLNGRYENPNGIEYLFVGNNKLSYEQGINENNSAVLTSKTIEIENGVSLVIFGQISFSLDRNNKILLLNQKNINDRALIVGGTLKDWTIDFQGDDKGIIQNQQNFDDNLLTGCLTFLDLQVDNIDIVVNKARCEDGVNFIRVDGSLNNIHIQNAMNDALDVDFSNLHFNNINIDNAGNDCVDFSAGDYEVHNSTLNECQDKAISVGEKTVSFFKNVNISNSNIGIATKDSSIATINNAKFKDTALCLSVYNKKQEFWGGKIKVYGYSCSSNTIYQEKNSTIEIVH